MEQRLHLWCKILDSADTASLCSPVESIQSILKKENAQRTLGIHGWQQLLKVGGFHSWTVGNNSKKIMDLEVFNLIPNLLDHIASKYCD